MSEKDELTARVSLLQSVLQITREQLTRSMYLNAELEGMLNLEKEKVEALQNELRKTRPDAE